MNPPDVTYELPLLIVWAMSEMWLITIIACIPPLRPLFLFWFWGARVHMSSTQPTPGASGYHHESQLMKGSALHRTQSVEKLRPDMDLEMHERSMSRTSASVSGEQAV